MKRLLVLTCVVLLMLALHQLALAQQSTVYMYDNIAGNWSGNGIGGTFRNLGTPSWRFTRQAPWTGDNYYKVYNQADNFDNNFNAPSGSKVWSGSLSVNASSPTTIFAYGDGNGGAGFYPVSNGKFYTFIFKDVSTAANSSGFVFETDAAPVTISSVSQSPAVAGCIFSEDVTVTVALSGAKSSQERVFVRYTTDSWVNSAVVEITSFDAGNVGSVVIPSQTPGTTVQYYVLTSAVAVGNNDTQVDLKTINYNNNGGANYSYTVSSPSSIGVTGAKALWLDQATIAWNGASGVSYKLLYDPDGGVSSSAACTPYTGSANPGFLTLTGSGTINGAGYPKNPNANGLLRLLLPGGTTDATIKDLLKGELVVASYDGSSNLLAASRVQMQSVLDALYAANAKTEALGVTYSGTAPSVKVWAPTAKSVTLKRYATSDGVEVGSHAMTLDATSGVWSVAGDSTWDRQFYLLDVQVYVPSLDAVHNNLVSDPYAVSLSQDGAANGDVRSQFANLNDADLKPSGWDSLSKPALANFEDIVVYEVHVRDFSANDTTVAAGDRGTYKAFTYDGPGPHANTALSDGMDHLKKLQAAGLTHIHLLPAFDIASVIEPVGERTEPTIPAAARDSDQQQAAVGAARSTDGFNWGYDPHHYGLPEGSYSTDPNGVTRILEFRDMVSALNQNGLRVVMDVVYNHTAASGQGDKSVLDKVVPGYYYRYNADGVLYTTSCCDDTATEYEMMEKLMIDTVVRFATAYKVDGFRFDLMNFHTRQNMLNLQAAVNAVDPKIYLYGEGWDFGSAKEKGLTACPNCYAQKVNMTGSGIGAFNDIIRDAAHGGYSSDPTGIRRQGFINGLSYDWNGYAYANRFQSDLWNATDTLRSALRGSGTDWNGQGSPFTDDPQEAVNYVEKHDNETLFDQNAFKLPNGDGSGNPGWIGSGIPTTSMADRVRSQNMGVSIVGLAQGVPFFQMGQDILRSKSLDRNSYDSGDWFNKVYWDRSSNNFGVGLPPTWDNGPGTAPGCCNRWPIMGPLLANTALDPATSHMDFAAAHLRETLRIRKSSSLFRLPTEAEINARTSHYNTGNTQDALIAMRLSDEVAPDLDASYENILVFFNANKIAQSITINGANGFALHPLHTDGVDDDPVITGGATFNDATDQFTIPARTTAVFVSVQPIAVPSTIDWVGLMWPRGGVANQIAQGAAGGGFDVYVQVYEGSVTPGAGQGAGIECYLHWGKYGQAWTDLAMVYNTDIGNNDEYTATIPQATLDGLAPGTYGFNAFCKKTSETGVVWKQDSYDISGNGADDDQGDGLITIVPSGDPRPAPAAGVFVHLFEWRWADIEKECTYLAQKGYSAVQVSPPNEHLVPTADQGGQTQAQYPWWVRYQPVTHDTNAFTSRSGTWAAFQSMVNTCSGLGVDIYVDAVINHMADIEVGSPPAGTSGTPYDANPAGTRFYGAQYQANDFHSDCTISSYADRAQVQRCKLSGLPDLDTGKSDVQGEIRDYLQALIDAGVKGFRIDGAKHMAAQDIAAILDGLTGDFYVFQEVIDLDPSERVRDWEYTPSGDVTEFAWSQAMGDKFNQCSGTIDDLEFLPYGNMMETRFAQVFVDNHDNQRGHGPGGSCVVDHRDGKVHVLSNVFTLAYPYGYPSVMSSYYWTTNPGSNSGDSLGPPSSNDGGTTWGPGLGADTRPVYGTGQAAGDVPANCAGAYPAAVTAGDLGKWVCEHRNTAIANMVRFRWVTQGEAVSDWWDNDSDQIAFGRGAKGYVAINRNGSSDLTRTFQTSLPEGVYCDITKFDFIPATGRCVIPGTTSDAQPGDLITVNASGEIENRTLSSMDAFAIHIGARMNTDYGTLGDSYGLPWHAQDATTLRLGQVWRSDDGVTLGAWTLTEGSVVVTVNGADGVVAAWFDWNQDGDFDDDGELAFADERVNAGQTKTITFPRDTWNYAEPLNARFRVYHRPVQTLRALPAIVAPEAPPQPSDGATGGETEDHTWTFSPLAVTLADFSAVQQGNAIVVTWETNSELNNRGFNLYRGTSAAGPDRQLNTTLIPSQSQGNPGGFVYTWVDLADLIYGTTYYYWLEDVDIYGTATLHGPVSVAMQTPTAVGLGQFSAAGGAAPLPWPLVVAAAASAGFVLLCRQRAGRAR